MKKFFIILTLFVLTIFVKSCAFRENPMADFVSLNVDKVDTVRNYNDVSYVYYISEFRHGPTYMVISSTSYGFVEGDNFIGVIRK